MNIAPGVVAELVDVLAGRLQKRAEALIATRGTWQVDGSLWLLGNARVTLAAVETITSADQIKCDCLLAPACAHRTAVALSLPVADDEDAPGGATQDMDDGACADAEVPVTLTDQQLAVVAQCRVHCEELLQCGTQRMPVTLRSGLHADLHRLRVHRLVQADRALTALLSGDAVAGPVDALARLLINLWRLSRGQLTQDVIGRSRATYRDVGGLTLNALFAEPVLAGSGYAGAVATFVDPSGGVWTVSRLSPCELGGVAQHYLAGEPWGGLSESVRVLSRRRLVVSGAKATSQGRLGGGKRVRAAIAGDWSRWRGLSEPYRVFAGDIAGGDRDGLLVGATRLQLSPVAAKLGAGLGTELFGQVRGAQVRGLGRRVGGTWELLGISLDDARFQLPPELSGVWYPGLDAASRNWVGNVAQPEAVEAAEAEQWPGVSPSVEVLIRRWLARVLACGATALDSPAIATDTGWLRKAGAPFAAELLQQLASAPQVGERSFDGRWQADPNALAQAWLALSQY